MRDPCELCSVLITSRWTRAVPSHMQTGMRHMGSHCRNRRMAQNHPNHRPKGGMEMTQPEQRRFHLAMLSWKQVVLCALSIALLPAMLLAQKPRMTYKSGPVTPLPTGPDDRVVVDKGNARPGVAEKKMCSIQPFPGTPNIASVTSLQIPHKAQREYEEPALPSRIRNSLRQSGTCVRQQKSTRNTSPDG